MDAGPEARGHAPEAPDDRLLVGRDREDTGEHVDRDGERDDPPDPGAPVGGERRRGASRRDAAGLELVRLGRQGHGDLPFFDLPASPSNRKTSASAGRKIVVLPPRIFS